MYYHVFNLTLMGNFMRLFWTLFLWLAFSLSACGGDSDGPKDTCEPGTTFEADDGCNTCSCPDSGLKSEAACTDMACPPECTEEQCGPAPGMPNYLCDDGVTTAGPGACEPQANGNCGWTIIECPDECTPGTTFPADDGCNTCSCPDSGLKSEAGCTAMGCPEYDPCEGKSCGDTCSLCDPADKECIETGVVKVCNAGSACVTDNGMIDCDGGSKTNWYLSCGDPVCSGHTDKPGMKLCTDEKAGDPCSDEGSECDPIDDCNAVLVCTTSDPKTAPGGCPMSRKETKTDIEYLDVDGLKEIYKELMAVRLAKWRYKNELPAPKPRLGFIIEDVEPSVAANSSRGQVDVYSFVSMAVAAVQHQDKELAALKKEVAELKQLLKVLKSQK
jgi:hypothetical protein